MPRELGNAGVLREPSRARVDREVEISAADVADGRLVERPRRFLIPRALHGAPRIRHNRLFVAVIDVHEHSPK